MTEQTRVGEAFAVVFSTGGPQWRLPAADVKAVSTRQVGRHDKA
jgi:hypothetical protein